MRRASAASSLEGVTALPGEALADLAGVFLAPSKEDEAALLPRLIVPKRPNKKKDIEIFHA